jgi:excisionase family DNA binding protein
VSKLISVAQASEMLGVTVKTLKIWTNEDKIKSYRTAGGHRRFRVEDIEKFLGDEIESTKNNKNVFVYCRVSTKKQADNGNLNRQKERLIEYCKERGYNIVNIFEEVASGLNDNRRELIKMFRKLHEVDSIVVEYPDRLARFGFNYLKEFSKDNGVEIEAVEQKEKLEHNEEMVKDLISVVTCFSARLYGARGGKKLKKVIAELETERGENSEINNKSNVN